MKLADSTDVSCMMYSQLLHKTDETALCTPQWVEVGVHCWLTNMSHTERSIYNIPQIFKHTIRSSAQNSVLQISNCTSMSMHPSSRTHPCMGLVPGLSGDQQVLAHRHTGIRRRRTGNSRCTAAHRLGLRRRKILGMQYTRSDWLLTCSQASCSRQHSTWSGVGGWRWCRGHIVGVIATCTGIGKLFVMITKTFCFPVTAHGGQWSPSNVQQIYLQVTVSSEATTVASNFYASATRW